VFIAIVFFFLFRVHAGKLGQVTNFTVKRCVDQYMVLLFCLQRGNNTMLGGIHARLCHAFLVCNIVAHCNVSRVHMQSHW